GGRELDSWQWEKEGAPFGEGAPNVRYSAKLRSSPLASRCARFQSSLLSLTLRSRPVIARVRAKRLPSARQRVSSFNPPRSKFSLTLLNTLQRSSPASS